MSADYSIRTTLNLPYEEAVSKVKAALKTEGFGVLTEIDVKATLKEKLDQDFREYTILGACNPPLAHQALNAQLNLGLLLPCNVIVYRENEACVVEFLDPLMMMEIAQNPALEAVAQEAQARLKRAAQSLA